MKKKFLSKLLTMLLVVSMVFTMLPASAIAYYDGGWSGWWNSQWNSWLDDSEDVTVDEQDAEMEIDTQAADNSEFLRIFHLDCGRKYFTVDQINKIIDQLRDNHYTHIELAFGNDGLRFLLDDMSVTVNGVEYNNEAVSEAIHAGNNAYYDYGTSVCELTQTDMDEIIGYAQSKNISVIPLIDIPGHTNALVEAMASLNISNSGYVSNTNSQGIKTMAFPVTDTNAVEFATALIKKYVDYFESAGSKYFNLGADECGYDSHYNDNGTSYAALADMIGTLSDYIMNSGMTTLIFNDGFRGDEAYLQKALQSRRDQIKVCYWTYSGYTKPTDLAQDFELINTHNKWYYVAGTGSGWNSYNWAKNNLNGTYRDCTLVDGDDKEYYHTKSGCMLAYWCDNPSNDYDSSKVYDLIETLADNNPDYFKASTRVDPEQSEFTLTPSKEGTLQIDGVLTLTASEAAEWECVSDPTDAVEFAVADDNLTATVTAKAAGTATITATAQEDSTKSATYTVTVTAGGVAYEERTITVNAGATETVTIKGFNYSGEYGPIADPSVAELVSIEGKDATEARYNYNNVSNVSVTSILNTNVSSPQSTNYYVKVGNDYYQLYATRSSSRNQYTYTYYYQSTDGSLKSIGSQNVNQYLLGRTNVSISGYPLYSRTGVDAAEAYTTITVRGLKAGSQTTLRVGNILYTIIVNREDLGNAPTLPIQLWITNNSIQTDDTQQTTGEFRKSNWEDKPQYLLLKASEIDGINSEQGVQLSDCVPELISDRYQYNTTFWGTIKGTNPENKIPYDFRLYKGKVLNKTTNFQLAYGDSMVNAAEAGKENDFQYIRYWNQAWEVSNDCKEWRAVTGEGSTTSASNCTEQLIAYYYMRTELTQEVTTDIVDWAESYENKSATSYALLDFAVKTETTMIPDKSTFPIKGRTWYYHCNTSDTACVEQDSDGNYYRRVDLLEAVNTDGSEIYMITVTPSNDTATKQLESTCNANSEGGDIYQGTEKVIWVRSVEDLDKAGFDDESLWYTSPSGKTKFTSSDTTGKYVGGKAELESLEIYKNQGLLVTYYVKSTAKDRLTVHYIDSRNNKEFHYVEISVMPDTFFDSNFGMNADKTLHDNSVRNYKGNTEYVETDLRKLPLISAEYRRINYELVAANLGDNTEQAKHAYLYYTFDNTESFVVDFGLPLTIEPADVGNLEGAKITNAVVNGANTEQAEVTVTPAGKVTYKLLKPLGENPDTFTVAYTGKGVDGSEKESATVEFRFYIYPASNVLYEGNFLTQGTESGRIEWTKTENNTFTEQQTQKVGDTDTSYNVFGYDAAYAGINSAAGYWKATGLNSGSDATKSLTTSFYGNAFDLIGSCGPNTGSVLVAVKDSNGKAVAGALIDTRYTAGTIDQVPLAHLMLKNEATYTATIYAYAPPASSTNSTSSTKSAVLRAPSTASYALIDGTADSSGLITDAIAADLAAEGLSVADLEIVSASEAAASVASVQSAVQTYALTDDTAAVDDSANTVTIDGFRVYRSADNAAYQNLSGEYQMTYQNILTVMNGQVITAYVDDKELECSVSEYEKSGGPQNEIYLKNNQSVSFKLMEGSVAYTGSIQVSLSAVTNGTTASYNLNGVEGTTDSTVEMYYTVTPNESGIVTITNMGNTLLAIGNVKLSDGVSYSAPSEEPDAAYSVEEAKAAVMALLSAPVDPEPEQPQVFAPDTFDVGGFATKLFRNKLVTLRVKVSEDVAYIIVNGKTYTPNSWFSRWLGYSTITVTDTIGRSESKTYTVIAYNADDTASEPYVVSY